MDWVGLQAIAARAWDIIYDYKIHLLKILATQVNDLAKTTVMRDEIAHQPTQLLFVKEIEKLQAKFEHQIWLLRQVCEKVSEQEQIISRGIGPSEEECEVDSVFNPGHKSCSSTGGDPEILTVSCGK